MKASELRIGNLLYNESWDDIQPIHAMDILAVEQCNVANKDVEWMAPVPLTQEWLLKFGFEDHGPQPDDDKLGQYRKYPIGMWRMAELYILAGEFDADIRWVHQLQNLYFALTGEELTIKENADNTANR